MYISFDDGGHWQPFQLNLPIVPITDLTIKNDDLVVATQGRAFWVLDDLTPLHQLKTELADKPLFVFTPRPAYRLPGGGFGGGDDDDAPPRRAPPGRIRRVASSSRSISKTRRPKPKEESKTTRRPKESKDTKISLEILDASGQVVREFTPKPDRPGDKWEPKKGMNRFVWNLNYTSAESLPGAIVWGGMPTPRAVPGKYQARVKSGPTNKR